MFCLWSEIRHLRVLLRLCEIGTSPEAKCKIYIDKKIIAAANKNIAAI